MATPTPSAVMSGFRTELTVGSIAATSPEPADGKKVHFYVTNHTKAQVETAGYFNPINEGAISGDDIINVGDIIFVAGDLDGTPFHNSYVVATVPAGDITITGHGAKTFTSEYVLNTTIALTDGDSGYVVAPIAGEIVSISTVLLGGAVATNDAVCTFKIGAAGAGTGITDGVVTIATAGSGVGTLDSATPSALNVVTAGGATGLIYCTVSGTPGGSRTAYTTIRIQPT